MASQLDEDEMGMENDPEIERKGIMKAIEYSDWHFTEITRYGHDITSISYTDNDRRLYQAFRSNFEDLDVSIVYDDHIKSELPKIKWREFMVCQEGLVEEYNVISLLRTDCRKDYSEDNSILVPRIQFLCIEISRTMECCHIGLQDRSALFPIFADKKLREDKVTSKLIELRNQLDTANPRSLLGILQEISQFRFLTRQVLSQTGIGRALTDLKKKTRDIAVITAARFIVAAWKADLQYLTDNNKTIFTTDGNTTEQVNNMQLYSWMSFSTPLYIAKKKLIQQLFSNVPFIQVLYTDMQPTGNNTNGISCQVTQQNPLPTELLNIFRIERLTFLELQKLSQQAQNGTLDVSKDIEIGADNEFETLVATLDKLRTLYSNCSNYHQQLILRSAIKNVETRLKNVEPASEDNQSFRSKGVSVSLLPPVKPLEFELEMYLILPALETKIIDIVNNLPAELNSVGKNKDLDAVWLELYNQMYSAEMLTVSTKVGVAQQDRDAVDPLQYQNEHSAKIVTQDRVQELLTKGIVVIDGAMSDSDTNELHAELTTLVEEGHMVPTFQENSSTRFDKICWLSENSVNIGNMQRPQLQKAILLLKGIAHELCKKANMKLKVPTVSMSAVYDGDGAHYVAHRDNVCTPQCLNSREITCIVYPNPGWKKSYGGQLRCYLDAEDNDATGLTSTAPLDVYPEGGRLVIFNSQKLLHEVMPSYHRRFAVSLWILGEKITTHQ